MVVVGYRADLVREELAGEPGVTFVDQAEQLGTGHAVMVCRGQIDSHRLTHGDGPVVIVTGIRRCCRCRPCGPCSRSTTEAAPACLLGTAHRDDPTGLGRVVRDADGNFVGIVEEKDATDEQRAVTEVNMSTYVFRSSPLALVARAIDDRQRPSRVLHHRLPRHPALRRQTSTP